LIEEGKQLPMSKTDMIQQVYQRAITNNVNPRIADSLWINSFEVVKLLKQEIFSELYLIQMSTGAQETRVLRKIKKVVFKDLESRH